MPEGTAKNLFDGVISAVWSQPAVDSSCLAIKGHLLVLLNLDDVETRFRQQSIDRRPSTGMQSLYVYDGTGNPAALITNETYVAFAYSYDPSSKPALTENSGGAGVPQNPYIFKVGLQDRATRWVKYGQRWYNPGIGRWTQMDTLDAPLDPANANRYAYAYAYAANDPINNSDPLGLVSAQCHWV